METEQKHTPGQLVMHSGMLWIDGPDVYPNGESDGIPIARMDRDTPHTFGAERDANAKFIALAWNCHDELVAALQEKLDHCCCQYGGVDTSGQFCSQPCRTCDRARAAIAKATKES